jgi:oxalate decarboxylase/phosphoglucose isomerase-like protein (cupin superfamily)
MTVNGERRRVTRGDLIVNKPFWSHALANDGNETLRLLVWQVDR